MSASIHTPASSRPGAAAPEDVDLHALGRRAQAARRAALGERATFTRTRRLQPSGAWRGPRDAGWSMVEGDDVAAVGGLVAAHAAGANMLLAHLDAPVAREAAPPWRLCVRLPYRSDDGAGVLGERLDRAVALSPWGVVPTPEDEALGLGTLAVFARCRIALPPSVHLVADVTLLDRRLAQMTLAFGADHLLATIVAERALRLGDNARNTALTRKEVVALVRGAGLEAYERLGDERLEECP